MSKLNARQQIFVDNYVDGMGIAEAYKCAGYHPKDVFSACSSGRNLLKKAEIQQAIEAEQEKRKNKRLRRLEQAANKAGDVLLSIIEDSHDLNVRYKAVKDALDRAGHKPADRMELTGLVEQKFRVEFIEFKALILRILDKYPDVKALVLEELSKVLNADID